MTLPQTLNLLSPDKAETDPDNDGLGYAPFAKNLANSIVRMTPVDGLVMAIYGQWGAGKTTLLNFVVHYLEQIHEDERPIIVHFNPWWFSGHEDLTRKFFDQLQAKLSGRHSFGKKLRNHIAGFADVISETPIPYASAGKAVAKVARPEPKDVPALKEAIAAELTKRKIKILVIIDDIDRLTGEEVRHLFRVIKAVSDFPNLIYLLAFDKKIVVNAVQQMQDLPGEAYLEKIVQVPFELPLPNKESLRQLMSAKLASILGDIPDELADQNYLLSVYLEGVEKFIHTPRDVIRLANTLSVTYPAVEGEVNPVDFLAIEALRVFRPKIYDVIRQNIDSFTGYAHSGGYTNNRNEDLKNFLENFITQVQPNEHEQLKSLLMLLFPKLQSVWKNTWYGAESTTNWRRQLRICSPDIFNIYFRLTIPEESISNAEMKRIVALTIDEKAFSTLLSEYSNKKQADGTTKARYLLGRLEDFIEKDISIASIPSIINVLFVIGDKLRLADKRRGMFDLGIDMQMLRLSYQLLRRLDEYSRFQTLRNAIINGEATATILLDIMSLAQQHGKYGGNADREEERIISSAHLPELEELVVDHIQISAKKGTLLQTPDLLRILNFWQERGGLQDVIHWLQKVVKTDKGLLSLLENSLSKNYSQTIGSYSQQIHYRLDPQWFAAYIDLAKLMQRVEELNAKNDLTDNQRNAVHRIIHEYSLRLEGKNPDSWRDE